MSNKKFKIKNLQKDDWAKFLFQEMRKDEKRPNGSGWMNINQIHSTTNKSLHMVRRVISQMIQKKQCEMFVGNIRSENGYITKAVWYRLKNDNWKNIFKNNLHIIKRQRIPNGKNWFTVGELTQKTGLARTKILRLIRENKLNKQIQIFDGYKYDSKREFLTRKIWYKLCLNGLNS